ncbi:MAG TPA: UrcA family protein [Steroidobacteraceae bacterium]|nr:UrcA family protein [Steroidobacteraceae bacterium]
MNTKPSLIVASIALASALSFSGTGFAQTPSPSVRDSISQDVHYGDLNLSTHAGVLILYRRIRLAAASGCGQVAESPLYLYTKCIKAATDAAVRAVNNPALTALHNGTKRGALVAAR